MLVFVFI